MGNMEILRNKFKNPPVEFRSAPFWSWNDRLCKEELVRQIGEMKDKGMGGFFMHSREGLETEYMSIEWMDCVKETIREAKEKGMGAWLYDEDRFPSGAAGGLVTAKGGDAFRSKALMLEVVKGDFISDDRVLSVFRAAVEGESLIECERLDVNTGHSVEENEIFLVLRREVSGSSEWFNDDAPVDNLNPDAVKAFIETTYEAYKKEIGEEFGRTVPGIFTDEPNIADFISVYTDGGVWIPWTDGFDDYFRQKRGYNILDVVPYMFFNGEKSSKVRHDYWRTISERFCETYSKQIGEWCERNNLAFTGHYFEENNMGSATRLNGSIMPHYRYQHIPGIDMLLEQTDEYLTVKQCTSVANQYGREHVLSETYGCTGWDFTFEGQKWIGDWQFVMGVTLRCQHLALYSLKGCRKRDYPPAFSYNTSWWKYNNVVEDYFARISSVMSQGKVLRDVLVIHPASTAWSMMGCNPYKKQGWGWWSDTNTIELNKVGDQFNDFIKNILAFHYDLDLGDETIMEEKGRVEGNKIYVNHAGYSVVVIPPVKTLFSSTLKLLEEFVDAGGKVIAVEPLADMIEGRKSDEVEVLFKHKNVFISKSRKEMYSLLEKLLPRKISICKRYADEVAEFLYMMRDLHDCRLLFVVNNDRNNSHEVMITVSSKGRVEEWDLLTGEFKEIGVSVNENKTSFVANFGPAGSRLYTIQRDKAPKIEEIGFKYQNPNSGRKVYSALGSVCKFTRTMPNALVLDKCSFRVNDGEWSEEMDVWQAQRKVRNSLGMRQVFYNGLPQRYKWVNKLHPKDGTPVEFRFFFYVRDIPEKDVYLVVEEVGNYKIRFNGNDIRNSPEGWFMDISFNKIKLTGVKQGINEVILSCGYLNRMEVEDCYVIGDFGVDVSRNVIREPDSLHFGDWCMQGYIHYCGSMIYHFDFNYMRSSNEKAVLELGEYSAVTIEARVNGRTARHIPWRAANGLDISSLLNDGVNRIDIEVMGSPRNLFGPLHQRVTQNRLTDWSFFRKEGTEYTPDYVVKPYGLMEQINIFEE